MRTIFATLAFLLAAPAAASDPSPEIAREAAPPQATGVVHALRNIPEACARLQGEFTGDPAHPYAFEAVRSGASCRPRAKLVDAAKVQPAARDGWLLNDLIRVPSAACPSQSAIVRVWRKPAAGSAPELDAQGRARIYLDDSRQASERGLLAALTVYATAMTVEGEPCD